MSRQSNWIPEIMYEESEDSEFSSHIPFIMVPQNEVMPKLIYIFESRDTGELEPGHDGNPVPVFNWDLHQYADLAILKNKLNSEDYDKVREALGLEKLAEAERKGKEISQQIKNNLEIN